MTRAALALVTLSLSALVLSCREAPRRTCVETLCFEWSEPHTTRSSRRRHTLRSDAWDGAWIDVQSWEPGPNAPASIGALRTQFARLRELTAPARSTSRREGSVGGRPAAVEDAVIDWRGQAYRRVTLIVPAVSAGARWVSVDVTARVADWDRASPRVRRYIESARWEATR